MTSAATRWIFVGLLLAACPGPGLDAVARARTAEEERAAFAAIGRGEVAFTAYAADGTRVDLGEPNWWKRVARLRISVGGASIDHAVIDPDNIDLLMLE